MGFLNILGAISGLGSLFSGGAKKSADARAQEAQANELRDRTALDRYTAQQNANIQNANLDLNQRQFSLAAPGQRAGTMVRGDILSSLQKPSGQHGKFNFLTGAPTLSDATRAGGQAMTRDAVLAQLAGDHFAPMQNVPVPQATPLPQASKWEQLGGLAGLIGAGAGVAQGMIPPPKRPYLPVASGAPSVMPGQLVDPATMIPGYRG